MVQVTAEVARLFHELRQLRTSPLDGALQRAVYQRLTGDGLPELDAGPASPSEIYAAVKEACRGYSRRTLSPVAIVANENFWTLVAKAGATEPAKQEDPDAGCTPEIKRRRARNRSVAADLERALLAGEGQGESSGMAGGRRAPEPGDPDFVPV